jgi:hypothetical protein
MGFGSMLFGDPERKRREKRQADLDADYYQRAKAYNAAKTKERIRIASIRGTQAAQQQANKKPFYQKVIGAATTLGKDVMEGASKTNPNALFSWDEPKTTRTRKKKRVAKRKK